MRSEGPKSKLEPLGSIPPLKRISTSASVADVLRERITMGSLPMGSPLSEQALCDSLGISRTPLRQALFELQGQGLVEIVPYHGARVFTLSVEQFKDLVAFRKMLEIEAVKAAMQTDRIALCENLEPIILLMEAPEEDNWGATFSKLDTQLHETIIAHCGNSYLVNAYEVISLKLAVLRNLVPRVGMVSQSLIEHREIFHQICEDNRTKTVNALTMHIAATSKVFLKTFCEEIAKNPQNR